MLRGRTEEAFKAAKLSAEYAEKAGVNPPGLALLILRALTFGGLMGKSEDATELWRKSVGAVSMDEIF
jgi:hypothetical protein